MNISRKLKYLLSGSFLAVPAMVQAQTVAPIAASQPDHSATAAPGSAPATPSTTSPQGPNQVGQSAAAQAPSDQGLQEIVVTAQQRTENLQKAAIPVSAVSGADLINAGITGINNLSKLVPSLLVDSSSQGNLIFIRGVGNFSFTPNSDPATAYNYDGIYIGRSSATFGAFYDLERVEVLRGPQGTLYGRNATAGAINILPVQPKLGQNSGYGTLSYGNYDALNFEGAVNIGLGSNAGFRMSGTYAKHDGYNQDGTFDDDSGGARAQLKVELTPDLTVRIEADYAKTRAVGSSADYYGKYALNPTTGQYVITPSGLPLGQGLFTPAAQKYRVTNGLASSLAGRFLDPLARFPFLNNDVYGIAYHVDWRTPIGTFSVLPAWRHAKKDNLSVDSAAAVGDNQDANQYTVEARLVGSYRQTADYIVGAYYFSEQVDDQTHSGASVQNSYSRSRYTTHSPAFYGRLTLHATDWLRFTGGVRYTEDHKGYTGQTTILSVVCPSASPAICGRASFLPYSDTLAQQPLYPAASGQTVVEAPGVLIARSDVPSGGKLDTSKVNYRAAVEIDVAPRSLLYCSVETGYRAGGFNTGFTYNPENITAFTVGMKNRLLDNRLQLNLELYDWKYRDQQLTYLGVNPFTSAVQVLTQNVGRSSIKGAEIEAKALLTRTTTVNADIQYLDAKYRSFIYNTPARPFSDCAVSKAVTFTVNCSGKQALNSPKWTLNLGAEQVFYIGNYQLTLDADTQYRSSRYVGFEYIAPEHVGSNWTSNAQISIGTREGRYVLSGFVRNIENRRVVIFGSPAPATNLIIVNETPPRTYGVRLSARF